MTVTLRRTIIGAQQVWMDRQCHAHTYISRRAGRAPASHGLFSPVYKLPAAYQFGLTSDSSKKSRE